METATKAQIQFLTKLQAEWAADEADGMPYTIPYDSLDAFIASKDWATQTGAFTTEVKADRHAARLNGTLPKVFFYGMPDDERRTATMAEDKAVAEETARRLAAFQERCWKSKKRMQAAGHASLEGLSKAEASALIDALN